MYLASGDKSSNAICLYPRMWGECVEYEMDAMHIWICMYVYESYVDAMRVSMAVVWRPSQSGPARLPVSASMAACFLDST